MDKGKIILIEDDEILSRVLAEELQGRGFEVHTALDGEAGLTLAQSVKADLILLDVILPKKNGFDVLAALKKSPATMRMPVVLLTMLGSDEDIKRGLQLGATDYIVKSQHALEEIVEKAQSFFAKESHPDA
jgi:DNA-binding response OmpR family regulator